MIGRILSILLVAAVGYVAYRLSGSPDVAYIARALARAFT